jgi:hypothetical protein
MNTPELRTVQPSHRTPNPTDDPTSDPPPKYCGGDYPPCPLRRVYEARERLIARIGGPQATERVDHYLFNSLRNAMELVAGTIPDGLDLYQLRNELIYAVAGTRDVQDERIHEAAERVDDYMFGVLESALQLTRPISGRRHASPA